MGCDPYLLEIATIEDVSIHAPAWGATVATTHITYSAQFQSTHPHGVRRTEVVTPPEVRSFNPRTRMGCD